ncbi:MAG TPA: ATP-binding protein, partial [Polyangiaceae bacterium]|nr:ATP-binding protein [Polyangiaceae bacterium]
MTQSNAPASSLQATTQRPPAPAQLVVLEGRVAGQKFKLEGAATIGRSPDANVMLEDAEVSRLHARISAGEDGVFTIEDLGSRNGTFVNGARVERRQLAYGDKLRIGPRIVLEIIAFDAVEDHIIQRQRFEAIGRLGVGIAHDLNNVLAALEAGAAYLDGLPAQRTLGDAEVRECISDLSLAAARAGELTRGILSFARGRAATRAAVDVSALVTEVVRMLRHTLDQSIRIEPRIDPNVIVHGSQSELHQVLLNLCLNARDAMPNGGTLRIAATKLKSNPPELDIEPNRRLAVLSVVDTGVGMDKETRARVFEPFFTTKREGAGYGLGLATAREIVGLHGGQLTLESQVDRGSTFRVYLPMMDAQSARLVSTEERVPQLKRRRLPQSVSVLLV